MKKKNNHITLFSFTAMFLIAIILFAGCGDSKANKTQQKADSLNIQEQEIPQPVPEPEPIPEPIVSTARLTVTGDLMVHSWQYNEAYDAETGQYNFMHNFADIKKYLSKADFVIGNLETTFAGEEVGISDYPCFNTPDSFADALKDAGFTLLTTANNHSMDKWTDGLLRTLDILDAAGIDHIGTYRSQDERDTIYIQDINGIKIAFLSYTYGTNGIPVKEAYHVNLLDENLIRADIQKAKELNPDMIVILPHMGNEYETYPREVFKNWANMMLNAGADIVLASHPHVLQPMEMVDIDNGDGTTRQGFVIYSLGNCISSQTTPPRNAGILLNIDLKKVDDQKPVISKVSFIPIWTQFRNAQGQDDFVVRSVYEMLTLSDEDQKALLRQKDVQRLKDIHSETTSLLLDKEIPLENIEDEYIFYERVE